MGEEAQTARGEDRLWVLQDRIRGFINDPRRQEALLRDSETWNSLCSALDVIGDSEAGIQWYLDASQWSDTGEGYVRLYGLLQILQVQQDAAEFICQCFRVPFPKSDVLNRVATIRNLSIGHPVRTKANKIVSAGFIARASMGKSGFDLHVAKSIGRGEIHRVDVLALAETQRAELGRVLTSVVDHLKKDEGEHRAMFRSIKLAEIFHPTIDWMMGHILTGVDVSSAYEDWHRRPLAHADLTMIRDMVNLFQKRLEERGLWIGGGWEWRYKYLNHVFDALIEYTANPDSSRINGRDAYVFANFLDAELKELRKSAAEIDAEYEKQQ